MNKKHAMALLLLLVAGTGCRRHTHPPSIGGAPRAVWTQGDVTIVEGQRLTLTLHLSRISDDDSEIRITSSDTQQLSAPDSVIVPAGHDTATVRVTARAIDLATETDAEGLPLEPRIVRNPVLTASTPNGSSTVKFLILEDDGEIGHAVGPVTGGNGIALLSGAGPDGIFGTGDEELITAINIGAGAPLLNKLKIGFLSGDPTCLPVIGPGGEALLLGSASVVTLAQVQSIPAAPAVTATATLPGKAGGISRPVMVGNRAVMTSRGTDLATSADDTLIVVQGIGTTTLTVRTVLLPGISTGDPSVPVALSDTSILIVTSGADFQFGTGDEVLSVVKDLDTATPSVVPLFSGFIRGDASGRPVASGGTIAAVETAGVDGLFSTTDDTLQVVRDVLTAPAVVLPQVAIGSSVAGPAGMPVATGSDAVIVPGLGLDGVQGTDDDVVVIVSPVSTDPILNSVIAAPRGSSDAAGVLVLLSSSSAVRLGPGSDGSIGTADDEVLLLTAIPSATATGSFVVGPVATFAPIAADDVSIVMAGLGPDHVAGTTDDLTLRLSGIGTSPFLSDNPTGAFAPLSPPALVPTPSGKFLAGTTSGTDATPGNTDDRLSVNAVP